MATAYDVLDKTLDLFLDHPERWIQEDFAREEDGRPCDATDPEAAAWCVLGAFDKASQELGEGLIEATTLYDQAKDAVRAVLREQWPLRPEGIGDFNDDAEFDEVLEVLREARLRAQAPAQGGPVPA